MYGRAVICHAALFGGMMPAVPDAACIALVKGQAGDFDNHCPFFWGFRALREIVQEGGEGALVVGAQPMQKIAVVLCDMREWMLLSFLADRADDHIELRMEGQTNAGQDRCTHHLRRRRPLS